MSDKQLVMELLDRLPADVRLQDIHREIEFLTAIREGEEQADQGKVIFHDQVKKEFTSWISNRLDASFTR
jgi:predicted transcriptional regulator